MVSKLLTIINQMTCRHAYGEAKIINEVHFYTGKPFPYIHRTNRAVCMKCGMVDHNDDNITWNNLAECHPFRLRVEREIARNKRIHEVV